MEGDLKENLLYLCRVNGIDGTTPARYQSAIASRTNVPQTTISGILEQGKRPRLSTLETLAHGLGVDAWQLLAPLPILRAATEADLRQLLRDYLNSSADGRRTLLSVARAQASFGPPTEAESPSTD